MTRQTSLFPEAVKSTALPEGLRYRLDLISAEEEAALIGEIARLPLKNFEFRGSGESSHGRDWRRLSSRMSARGSLRLLGARRTISAKCWAA